MPKDNCPKCDGKKDTRAKMCQSCRFKYAHPRLGTGVARRLNQNGYITVMVDGKSVYEHRKKMEDFLGRKL